MRPIYSRRRLTIGAELQKQRGADLRVWAPACRTVDLVAFAHEGRPARTLSLTREPDGHFNGFDPDARAGGRYWFRLDGERLRPDPASRLQPEGPHAPSQYVDPTFGWTDGGWGGLAPDGQVIYEMHVGTFTREGTWAAAVRELDELARMGITVIEMMPIADFAGRFGWGYDGVGLYAPTRLYGRPDDLRAFVDRAHALGIGVILDVVYNHLGPDGNYLSEFSPDYFTDQYTNDWGRAINFEGPPRRGSSSSRMRPIGSMNSISMACASTLPRTSMMRRRNTSSSQSCRVRGRQQARARFSSLPRTSRRTRGSCGRRRHDPGCRHVDGRSERTPLE